jgi:hypothetical protein
MPDLKRLLQVSVLAVCVLSATVVFAADDSSVANTVANTDGLASSSTEQPEASSLQEAIDFGALFTPEPINRSCNATSQCTPVGGIPVSCAGATTCSSAANWVTCDGTIYPCTCYPPGVPTCTDPVSFCACWSQSPTHNWGMCRQLHCL